MSLRIVRKADLVGTPRHIKHDTYETVRFLLAGDQAGLTLTDIVLAPHVRATYGYDQHIEVAYCLEGRAEILDLASGERHSIEPGTLWVAPPGSRFEFEASSPTRLICAFTPPFAGHETGFVGDQ